MIPVTDTATIQGAFSLIKDIAFPTGSAVLMGVGNQGSVIEKHKLEHISNSFKKTGVFSSTIVMKTKQFADGVNFGNQALMGAYFRPNITFLNMAEKKSAIKDFKKIMEEAKRLEIGYPPLCST